ncbi:Retrovirus-related Pol polyprotein from transposon RE2, partial [Linum perenne]
MLLLIWEISQFIPTIMDLMKFLLVMVQDLRTGAPLLRGRNKDDVYELPEDVGTIRMAMVTTRTSDKSWHQRLGHPSTKSMTSLIRSHHLPVLKTPGSTFCDACLSNKSHKLPFSVSTLTSSRPFDLLFSDVWGPTPKPSIDGFQYYLIFVDHYTRYTWFYPLRKKSDVLQVFLEFRKMVENYFSTTIRRLYTDGGGEFVKLRHILNSHGITHLLTPPYTPEHNGLAERKHRHIVETGITLLHQANLPHIFWSFAFATAVYLINRMPSSALRGTIPFQTLFNISPNFHKLRIFGCLCYPWLRPYSSSKIDPRSRPCLFLGYSHQQSAYKCLDPVTKRIFLSRHVVFVEDKFPGFITNMHAGPNILETLIHATTPSIALLPKSVVPTSDANPPAPTLALDTSSSNPADVTSLRRDPSPMASQPAGLQEALPLARQHSMVTRARNNIFKPKKLFIAQAQLSPPLEPTSLKEALQFPEWVNALNTEYQALVNNGTWTLVPRQAH